MKRNYARNLMIILTAAAVVGLGSEVFAGWGRGGGPGGGRDCPRWGANANLSQEDVKKLEAERKAFFEETADLRQQMREKRAELRAVMVKKAPDAQQAADIQAQISDLRKQFDQKRLQHILRMKQINPEAGAGFGARGNRRGKHRGWDRDGGGPCPGWGRGGGYRAGMAPGATD